MDTLRSPIPQGSMGGPTGTGRSPRLHAALQGLLSDGNPESSNAGLFSEEVERAEERAELGGTEQRLAQQADERRSQRHETFGKERSEPQAKERASSSDAQPPRAQGDGAPTEQRALGQPAPRASAATTAEAAPSQTPAETRAAFTEPDISRASPLAPAAVPSAGVQATGSAAIAALAAPAVSAVAATTSTTPNAIPGLQAATRAEGPGAKQPAPPASAPPSPDEAAEAAEILRQIKVATSSGVRRLTVELSPLALGRVQIRVGLRGESLDAVVEADEPATYAALERQSPELRALLSEAMGGREVTLTLLGGESREQRTRQGQPTSVQTRPAQGGQTEGSADAPAMSRTNTPIFDEAGIDTYA